MLELTIVAIFILVIGSQVTPLKIYVDITCGQGDVIVVFFNVFRGVPWRIRTAMLDTVHVHHLCI